jgi:hypothetical protein
MFAKAPLLFHRILLLQAGALRQLLYRLCKNDARTTPLCGARQFDLDILSGHHFHTNYYAM